MEHQYSVYGVSLSSDIPFDFPARSSVADGPHVRFAHGHEAFATAPDDESSSDPWFVCHQFADGSLYLRWSGLYDFVIDPSGTCVKYRTLRDGDRAVLQNFLFGQALSFALIRQNVEPVHAAVVDLGGYAIALLGDCTYGKSTLAGSLLRAGCRLVSDDLLVVRETGRCIMARAGAGRIKLLPDSASAVLGDTNGGVRIIPSSDKRVFRLGEHLIQRADVPLRAFVVLPTPEERAECDHIDIRRMAGPQVFHELLKNTFVRYVDEGRRLHQNFSWNAHLASTVAGYRLQYPSGINRLPSVATTLIDHFRQHSHGEPR